MVNEVNILVNLWSEVNILNNWKLNVKFIRGKIDLGHLVSRETIKEH